MGYYSLVSGPNLMILKSYETLKSTFSYEKCCTKFGVGIREKSSAQIKCLKLDILDTLAFEADLEGQIKSE